MIATRTAEDVENALATIEDLPTVAETMLDSYPVNERSHRIGVVRLEDGIERVPPSVCRAIGEGDFGIEMIERFDDHLEVVLR